MSKIKFDGHDKTICAFLESGKNFLIYCGNAGIGKTYFCAALLEFVMTKYSTVRYWHEADLLKRVRASMNDERGDYLESLKWLIDDDFVMIDDIGSTGLTDWRKEILFEVINQRYNSMKPTVFTSNFSLREFKEYFHERVGSRLFAKENYIVEILDGQDLRAI